MELFYARMIRRLSAPTNAAPTNAAITDS